MKPSVPYAPIRAYILSDPKVAGLYLKECFKSGDSELVALALKDVAEAQGGMAKLAKKTKLNRETLYRTLSKRGNPRLDTLLSLFAALNIDTDFSISYPPSSK